MCTYVHNVLYTVHTEYIVPSPSEAGSAGGTEILYNGTTLDKYATSAIPGNAKSRGWEKTTQHRGVTSQQRNTSLENHRSHPARRRGITDTRREILGVKIERWTRVRDTIRRHLSFRPRSDHSSSLRRRTHPLPDRGRLAERKHYIIRA